MDFRLKEVMLTHDTARMLSRISDSRKRPSQTLHSDRPIGWFFVMEIITCTGISEMGKNLLTVIHHLNEERYWYAVSLPHRAVDKEQKALMLIETIY